MTQAQQRSPWILIATLVIIGSCSAALSFWLVDHRNSLPGSGWIIAFGMITFFVCFTWALLGYIGWRDRLRAHIGAQSAARLTGNVGGQNPQGGTIYDLVPGAVYQVQQEFTDHYGNLFRQGERLCFKQRHFLPYHGGHTVVFAERPLYLQESENVEIIDNFSRYITRVSS